MGLTLLFDNIGDVVPPVAGASAAGYAAINLHDGNRRTFWRGANTSDVAITYDMGSGKSFAADYVVVVRADLLIAAGATIVVQHSPDASAWTNAFTAHLLAGGDLLKPSLQDWYAAFTTQTKRAWRIRLTTLTGVPQFAGLWIGSRRTLSRNAAKPIQMGFARAHRGFDWSAPLDTITEADAAILAAYASGVSYGWPGEAPVETTEGAVYGGRPHFVYDAPGGLFRERVSASPMLVNAILMNPAIVTELQSIRSLRSQLSLRQVV